MLLCDETIWAIPDGVSGIEFANPEEGKFFVEQFNKKWDAAEDAVAREHEDCLRYNPATVIERSGSLFVWFLPLDIPYMDGMYCDIDRGPDALEEAIQVLKEHYPNAEFRGCIQYPWSDAHGGDVIKFDVSSKQTDEPYAFVGDVLKEAVEDEEEYFWDHIEDSDDLDEIEEDFEHYRDWVGEEAIEKLNELREME